MPVFSGKGGSTIFRNDEAMPEFSEFLSWLLILSNYMSVTKLITDL